MFLEGAGWNKEDNCIVKQRPKQLIQELPILKIIPIEAHRLKLQVSAKTILLKGPIFLSIFTG